MNTKTTIPSEADQIVLVTPAKASTKQFEWFKLLAELAGPASLVERGLAAALAARRGMNARYPRRAAVLGTNRLGLLATLLLTLRNLEVVVLDDVVRPDLSGSKMQAPSLARTASLRLRRAHLVEKIAAHFEALKEPSLEGAGRKFGPFDLIVLDSAGSFPVLKTADELAAKGALVDFTCGDATMEVWVATPTPCFLVKHQVTLTNEGDDAAARELAIKDLADALHPGWLARVLASSTRQRVL